MFYIQNVPKARPYRAIYCAKHIAYTAGIPQVCRYNESVKICEICGRIFHINGKYNLAICNSN